MDHLIEIVQFLSKNKFKHLEVFVKGSRLELFYEKIRDGSLKTEQQARDYFFPDHKNAKTYYYRLANQLEERLISLLFLVDFNQSTANTIQRDATILYRNYAAVTTLLVRYMRPAAIKIAEESIKTALKYEFTDMALLLARHLALHYGSIKIDKKKYQYYAAILAHQQELLQVELLAEKYYAENALVQGYKASTNAKLSQQLAEQVAELQAYSPRLSSYRFNLVRYELSMLHHEITGDYPQMIAACQEALDFYDLKVQSSRTVIANIYLRIMIAQYMLKQYEEAEMAGKKILALLPQYNQAWLNICDRLFRLYILARRYADALSILLLVKTTPDMTKWSILMQERWRANEIFMHYLIRLQKVSPPEEVDFKFRPKKFLNEFRKANQDKAGINMALITLNILFLILDKEYDEVANRMDALRAYAHRHLRKEKSHYRSNCFIKMLLQLETGYFHPVAVQRKAEPYFQKLKQVPVELSGQDVDLEVIPYETLWEYILESLSLPGSAKIRSR